jgi:DNA-binding transcriptional LysR family regulator
MVERPVLLDGRLKIRHLIIIDAIGATGSVVRAAERLHVTQPVVTRALHEVEEILGVRLYDRGPRGLTPTAYGEAFLEHARAVLAQLRAASDHLAELAGADTGTVAVGTYLAGSNLLLPHAIARLKHARPRITVIVREADPETLAAELLAGTLDLVVGRLTVLDDAARLRQEPLYVEPVRLIARVDHPAADRAGGTLADMAGYLWVVPVAETALRRELEAAFLREGVALPANRVECMSILTTRHLLLHTDAVAALPELVTRDEPGLAPLPVALPSLSSSVGITTPAVRPSSPAARALADHLRSVAADLRARADPS